MDRGNGVRSEVPVRENAQFASFAQRRLEIPRSQFPPRPFHLRRPILQQRLAAGTSQADDETDLGQCRPGRPQDGRARTTPDGGRGHDRTCGTQSLRAGLGAGRTSRQFRHHPPWLRPHARRPRRNRRRLRCLPAADLSRAMDRDRRQTHEIWPDLQTRFHPGLSDHGHARRRTSAAGSGNEPRGISQGPEVRAGRAAPARADALPERRLHQAGICLGHGYRSELLCGLQQLHDRMPVGEQHRRRRQGTSCEGAPHALAARRRLLPGRSRPSQSLLPARPVHAMRERALRVGVPRGRNPAQHRRPERHGLQPLRGDALLLEQLSLQGAPLQLPALPGLGYPAVQDDAESRCQRAQPRRHGEMHLLRTAHQRAPH